MVYKSSAIALGLMLSMLFAAHAWSFRMAKSCSKLVKKTQTTLAPKKQLIRPRKKAPISSTQSSSVWSQEIYWNWDKLDITSVQPIMLSKAQAEDALGTALGHTFGFGGALSSMQIEGYERAQGGGAKSSWTQHERNKKFPADKRAGYGIGHKKRYKEDLRLLKELGLTIYRFSIAWEKVEPTLGNFDTVELDWYVDMINTCSDEGIIPMINFFHHYWPLWFDRLGAWDKAENVPYFIEYAAFVYNYLYTHVKNPHHLDLVMTLNEPVGYAMAAYLVGKYPPGQKGSLFNAGHAVKNLLDAHIGTYDAIKLINPQSQIGIALVFIPLDSFSPNNPITQWAARHGNYLMHDVRMNYLKNGHFRWTPLINDYNYNAIGKMDWVGLNYYTHKIIGLMPPTFEAKRDKDQTADNNGNIIYPEGLYRSIHKAAEWGLPIIITENGIQTEDDELKNKFVQQHLYVVKKALQEGYDIRGYMWWGPIDCYSWNKGFVSHYGFYRFNPITRERTFLPNAAQYLQETIEATREAEQANCALL